MTIISRQVPGSWHQVRKTEDEENDERVYFYTSLRSIFQLDNGVVKWSRKYDMKKLSEYIIS